MADDQGPKIASIDELVNELTKKAGAPSPSAPPTGGSPVPPVPKPTPPAPAPVPKPAMPAPAPEIPKPRFTPPPLSAAVPPRPAPTPSPAPAKPSAPPAQQPSGAGPIKEYQSSIRTMKEDIISLKQGQKTAGVDISRHVEPTAPPAPVPPKPTTTPPPQQFKMPSVSLGETQKAPTLPQAKAPMPPLSTGGPSAPSVKMPAPTPAAPKTEIYAPLAPAGGIPADRRRLFMIIGGAAVLFGVLYWFLVLRVPTPEIVEEIPTRTPTPTAIETPVVTLSGLIGGPEIVVSVNPNNAADSFAKLVEAIVVEAGSFGKIMTKDTQGADFSWSGLVEMPQQVRDSLGGEALLVAYGQKEFFGPTGIINPTVQPKPRAVMIFEVKDQSSALQALTAWETTMSTAFSKIFGLDLTTQLDPNFLDNTHQGSAIRYRNFPWADKSIDYGIISAVNGKAYLVIAGSRESMFASIDKLKGQ